MSKSTLVQSYNQTTGIAVLFIDGTNVVPVVVPNDMSAAADVISFFNEQADFFRSKLAFIPNPIIAANPQLVVPLVGTDVNQGSQNQSIVKV